MEKMYRNLAKKGEHQPVLLINREKRIRERDKNGFMSDPVSWGGGGGGGKGQKTTRAWQS
jgi:hypothetical protein